MPDLPTAAEMGFPGFELSTWMAVLAPKGKPPARVDKISHDINRITRSRSYQDALGQRGSEARTSTPRELAARIRSEYERNRTLIKTLGVRTN